MGFPGGTEEDFAETLRVVGLARFASAFTFQYSARPGTPAADLPDQVPKDVVQERYERLLALQEQVSLEENLAQVGRTVEVLVAEGEGARTERRCGSAGAPQTTVWCTCPCLPSSRAVNPARAGSRGRGTL